MRINRSFSNEELELLYRERFDAFLQTATAYTGDVDAGWETVHDAFALALRRRRAYRGDAPLEAWVWKILINVAHDQLRRRKRGQRPTVDRSDRHASSVERSAEDDIRTELLRLPRRQRLAVFLRYYADLDYDAIADILGVKTGTVAASLNAARRSLRAELREALE